MREDVAEVLDLRRRRLRRAVQPKVVPVDSGGAAGDGAAGALGLVPGVAGDTVLGRHARAHKF